jgi:hypothetical protein
MRDDIAQFPQRDVGVQSCQEPPLDPELWEQAAEIRDEFLLPMVAVDHRLDSVLVSHRLDDPGPVWQIGGDLGEQPSPGDALHQQVVASIIEAFVGDNPAKTHGFVNLAVA